MSPITVLAVDDNIVVRAGLVALLETADDIRVVGEASNAADALSASPENSRSCLLASATSTRR